MTTWRINLKPAARNGVDARHYCLTKGIVGIGWQVDYESEPLTWDFYEAEATEQYYNDGDAGWWPAWNALYYRMQIGNHSVAMVHQSKQ